MSTKKQDGGPAFPGKWKNQSDRNDYAPNGAVVSPWEVIELPGMSMRDWFAGQVLAGYLANAEIASANPATMARDAYTIADAMIAERRE